jgi:ankyrin repeat protein
MRVAIENWRHLLWLCCQAVKSGNKDEVEKWLEYDKLKKFKRVRVQDKHGYAPVHYAAKFNRLEILKLLHTKGNAGKNF